MAIAFNPSNYINHQSAGNVYSTVSALGVEGAYEKSLEYYNAAKVLNPLNPGIDLAISRTALSNNKLIEAREYANKSLVLKPNLIDTLLTLSQIARAENNKTEAVSFAERALALDSQNEDLIAYVTALKSGSTTPPPVTTDGAESTETNPIAE
jgi:tetratricopeptide (TPR) repeat protein